MSIRWRESGELVCAAMSEPMDNDCYIDDRLHYKLSVELAVIIADEKHEDNGLWYWVETDDKCLLK